MAFKLSPFPKSSLKAPLQKRQEGRAVCVKGCLLPAMLSCSPHQLPSERHSFFLLPSLFNYDQIQRSRVAREEPQNI